MGRPTVHFADNKTNNVNSGNLGEVISIFSDDIEDEILL